jgi:hypothetical protein
MRSNLSLASLWANESPKPPAEPVIRAVPGFPTHKTLDLNFKIYSLN